MSGEHGDEKSELSNVRASQALSLQEKRKHLLSVPVLEDDDDADAKSKRAKLEASSSSAAKSAASGLFSMLPAPKSGRAPVLAVPVISSKPGTTGASATTTTTATIAPAKPAAPLVPEVIRKQQAAKAMPKSFFGLDGYDNVSDDDEEEEAAQEVATAQPAPTSVQQPEASLPSQSIRDSPLIAPLAEPSSLHPSESTTAPSQPSTASTAVNSKLIESRKPGPEVAPIKPPAPTPQPSFKYGYGKKAQQQQQQEQHQQQPSFQYQAPLQPSSRGPVFATPGFGGPLLQQPQQHTYGYQQQQQQAFGYQTSSSYQPSFSPAYPQQQYITPHQSQQQAVGYDGGYDGGETTEPAAANPDDEFNKLLASKTHGANVKIMEVDARDRQKEADMFRLRYAQQIEDDKKTQEKRSGTQIGGLTKRKHQITYIVQEAQARELELKNHWAASRQAQMAASKRYGFR